MNTAIRILGKKDFLQTWRILLYEVGKMLIDTCVTIAYKCSSCGSFEFFNISLFTLLKKKESKFYCRCRKSCITVKQEGESGFLLKTPCMGCGNEHIYFIGRTNMLFNKLSIFNCPETGLQQCFIGNDILVRKKVDSLEKELDELIDMFGYESYFVNTQVMLDTLNKIHDIAAQGCLYCECGSIEVELVLLSDRILLKCSKCSAGRIIPASTNEDLKEILTKQSLPITADSNVYPSNNTVKYLTKTDG